MALNATVLNRVHSEASDDGEAPASLSLSREASDASQTSQTSQTSVTESAELAERLVTRGAGGGGMLVAHTSQTSSRVATTVLGDDDAGEEDGGETKGEGEQLTGEQAAVASLEAGSSLGSSASTAFTGGVSNHDAGGGGGGGSGGGAASATRSFWSQWFTTCCSAVAAWKKLTWFQLVDMFHDAFTVSFSLLDIMTDVLVCIEFYQNDHMVFFWASIIIFCIAQLSYAFLFVGTWAAEHRNSSKIFIFLAVLPVGQLIPVFVWLESFRIPIIDTCLTKLQLKPTGLSEQRDVALGHTDGNTDGNTDGSGRQPSQRSQPSADATAPLSVAGDEDSLWAYIQQKYTAHAGFLAEAFIEAIPQGVLQVVAIILLHDTTGLNVVSILMSISVVASKGYLVAYSIHRPSFIFNYLCIAGDSFNLFATATWLFMIPTVAREANNDDDDDGLGLGLLGGGGHYDFFFNLSDTNSIAWWCMAVVGMAMCAYGGFFLLGFTMIDDHLKLLFPDRYVGFKVTSVAFNIYFVRLMAWCLAIVPCSVVYLTAKLSLLPVCLFNSLDPEHASHSSFYKPLFRYLHNHHQVSGASFFEDYWKALEEFPWPHKWSYWARLRAKVCAGDADVDDVAGARGGAGAGGVTIRGGSSASETSSTSSTSSTSITSRAISASSASGRHTNNGSQIGDADLRLQIANRFISTARVHMGALEKELAAPKWRNAWLRRQEGIDPPLSAASGNTFEHRVITAAQAARDATNFWIGTLDTTQTTRFNPRAGIEKESLISNAQKVLDISNAEDDAAAERAKIRMANMAAAAGDAIGASNEDIHSRSEVLRIGLGLKAQCKQIGAELTSPGEPTSAALLRMVALFDLFNIGIAAAVWLPTTAAFVVYSSVYSLTNLGKCGTSETYFLPCVLTYGYLVCLVALLFLVPVVWRFQLLRTDLVSVKGFPDSFYHVSVVKEVIQRYRCAQVRIEVTRLLESNVGHWNALEIKRYLDEGNRELAYV